MKYTSKETSVDYIPDTVDNEAVRFMLSYKDGKIIPRDDGLGDANNAIKGNDIAKPFRNTDEVEYDSEDESCDSCSSFNTEEKDDDQHEAPSLDLNIELLFSQYLELGQCLSSMKFHSLDEVAR